MRGGHPVPGALVYSMAEGLVIPTTLQGTGLAFLSMGFDIKGPTYVDDTIHVEIEVTEIKPTSKNPTRALVRTTNDVKNQKGETVLVYTPLAHDAGTLSQHGQGRGREGRHDHGRLDRPLRRGAQRGRSGDRGAAARGLPRLRQGRDASRSRS